MAVEGERLEHLSVLSGGTHRSLVLRVVLEILALLSYFCSWSHVHSQTFQDIQCLWGAGNMSSRVLCGPDTP